MPESTTKTYSNWTPELETAVRLAASDAGFCLTGIVRAEAGPADSEGDRFASWVEQGRAGQMEYLKRRDSDGTLVRSALQVAIPWARSIMVCAFDYDSAEPLSIEPAPAGAGWIGRYAWSGRREPDGDALKPTDYHEDLLARLRLVEARLRREAPCQTRCYVDTGPLVERDFAAKAGIGWIGKNTCVLNQERGSWLLLGVIVTALPVMDHATWNVAADRCGTCTRCIDACPTNALVAPREMDASLCIAYLTIEKKGVIAPELREAMGRQVFGCDICQDVCPWNSKSRNGRDKAIQQVRGNDSQSPIVYPAMDIRRELVNPSLARLAAMDSSEFKRWFKGSPLERTGKKRLHRNVAIAMGNSGKPEFLPRLREWSTGEDAVLAEAALWAIERIQSASIGS